MSLRNLRFPIGSLTLPACSSNLIDIAIIAEFHHIVDSRCPVPIVVVVRLPEGAIGIDGSFVVVAKVMSEHLHVA